MGKIHDALERRDREAALSALDGRIGTIKTLTGKELQLWVFRGDKKARAVVAARLAKCTSVVWGIMMPLGKFTKARFTIPPMLVLKDGEKVVSAL